LVKKILRSVQTELPDIALAHLAPMAYADLFSGGETIWLEDVKAAPISFLRERRRRGFDVVIRVLPGNPTFPKVEAGNLILKPRRFIIYNENTDVLIVDRARWKDLRELVLRRTRMYYPGSLLFVPFGLL
jgi:hypothetical protein